MKRKSPRASRYWMIGALLGSIGIFAVGIYFKRESYKLAIKAGIDINQIK
jgi:hypothetical protein